MKHAQPTGFERRLRAALVVGSAVVVAIAVAVAANISLSSAEEPAAVYAPPSPWEPPQPSSPPVPPSSAAVPSSVPPATTPATTAPSSTPAPKPTATTTLTATRRISGTFDGRNAKFLGGGNLGDGGQSEDQDPLFELADGATLADVVIGAPAADGVHCLGSCTLRNVWWLDVGEDAATFKGTSASQSMRVTGGGALHAADVVFQHNGPGTFIVSGFRAEDIGKLYRSCGNCARQFTRRVLISNVTVTAPLTTLAGVNINFGDRAIIDRATLVGGTARNVCALFRGSIGGSAAQISNLPDGDACTATNITLR